MVIAIVLTWLLVLFALVYFGVLKEWTLLFGSLVLFGRRLSTDSSDE